MLASHSTTGKVTYTRGRGGAVTIPGLSLVHDGGRTLFHTVGDGVSLRRGIVTGLVGTNGAGKTSFARLLAAGTLPGYPQDLVVEYLAASDDEEFLCLHGASCEGGEDAGSKREEFDATAALELKPVEYMQMRMRQRSEQLSLHIAQLEAQLEGDGGAEVNVEEVANRLSELYELEEDIAERAQREMHHAIEELGLGRYADRPLSQLSSGWRYKCRLVAAFLTHPDFLIVDEPSFLDAASTRWFVEKVINAAKTDDAIVLLISHKEAMLDALCESILYNNSGNQSLTAYHCGYSIFRSTHADQVQHAAKKIAGTESQQESAEKSLKKLQTDLWSREKNLKSKTTESADQRFIKGKNKEAKQKADRSAASKLKRAKKHVHDLEEARRQARTERVKPLHIDGTPNDGTVVSLQEVAFAYEGEDLFQYCDAVIDASDRILLTGPNGCGKSTLVKVILGDLEPTRGTVSRTGNFIYFPQTALSDLLRQYGNATARDFLGGHLTETQARNHLGNYDLAKDLALRPINTLSAGQRVRLWLAKQSLLHPNPCLLVVDEISENVDRETRDSLVQLLSSFQAAVLVVSHDADFRGSFQQTKTWELTRFGIKETYAD